MGRDGESVRHFLSGLKGLTRLGERVAKVVGHLRHWTESTIG